MRSMSLIDKSVPVAGSRVGLGGFKRSTTFKKGTYEIFQKIVKNLLKLKFKLFKN